MRSNKVKLMSERSRLSNRWYTKWGLTLCAILFTFLTLEIATRSYDAMRGRGFFSNFRDLHGSRGFKPYTMFGFDLYADLDGEKCILSRHGEPFSLKKPERTLRIVAFGGSTTENQVAYVSTGNHYPKLVQEKLRNATGRQDIEVINLGKSAYSTLHTLINLEMNVVSWDPDLIIVSHNLNDLLTSYWPDFEVDYSHKYFTDHYLPRFEKQYATHNRLLACSQFYCAMQPRFETWIQPKSFPICRESVGNSPSNEIQQVFARNLKSIVAIAKQHDIEVVLGTQPLEVSEEMFVKHMAHKKYNSVVTYPDHDEFVNHHKAMNQILRQVSEDLGCGFVDANAALAGETQYFLDFVHYTPKGVQKLADAYADYLLEVVSNESN